MRCNTVQPYFCTMCADLLLMAPSNPCILKYEYGSMSESVKSFLISHRIQVMWSVGSWWWPRISYILIATSEFENNSSSLSREGLHINFSSVHDIRYDIVWHCLSFTYYNISPLPLTWELGTSNECGNTHSWILSNY